MCLKFKALKNPDARPNAFMRKKFIENFLFISATISWAFY